MESALRLSSWLGFQKEWIDAVKIKSHADARKLAPFMDEHKKPLIWVNWSKPKGFTRKRKAHFRHYPEGIKPSQKYLTVEDEIQERKKSCESPTHQKAKEVLAEYLQNLINENLHLKWAFKDEAVSDFSITGDLMSGVTTVQKEYRYKTPYFEKEYQFDVALLGDKITKEPIILGVIEIEKENKVGILKSLICKSLGFPLVSINIEDLKLEEITLDWAARAIKETTENSQGGLRRNYIYIHYSLYPVYTNIPVRFRKENKHQYVIFCNPEKFETLWKCLEDLTSRYNLTREEVLLDKPKLNKNNIGSQSMFKNEGSIAGQAWQDFNSEQFIRLQMKIPFEKTGNLYYFHLLVARLLNAHFNTLVGYKYSKGITNDDVENPIWIEKHWDNENEEWKETRLVQKQLTEPFQPIIDYLKDCGLYDKIKNK